MTAREVGLYRKEGKKEGRNERLYSKKNYWNFAQEYVLILLHPYVPTAS